LRIEQRANKNDLESAYTPISDRSSTFDGHMHNSEIRNMHGEDLRDEVAEQVIYIIYIHIYIYIVCWLCYPSAALVIT